jgi:uncharacterized integral membrane protein (TIGR00698 family)
MHTRRYYSASMQRIPGLALLLLISLISVAGSSLFVVAGKHPVEASALAIVLGIAVRTRFGEMKAASAGIVYADPLLIWGIVLLGAQLQVSLFTQHGWNLLGVIVLSMALSLGLIIGLARLAGLSSALGLLLGVGTTICGTSAIAIVAPIIKAKQEETSYAVATVALLGLLAIFIYPLLATLLAVPEFEFGLFAGMAIHSTPQVVGAGYLYSDLSGQTATAVKLVRNCFMAPLALIIAAARPHYAAVGGPRLQLWKAFPWFLFAYFLVAYAAAQHWLSKAQIDACGSIGKFLIVVGMAGIGLNTQWSTISTIGLYPLKVGAAATLILGVISATLLSLFMP